MVYLPYNAVSPKIQFGGEIEGTQVAGRVMGWHRVRDLEANRAKSSAVGEAKRAGGMMVLLQGYKRC